MGVLVVFIMLAYIFHTIDSIAANHTTRVQEIQATLRARDAQEHAFRLAELESRDALEVIRLRGQFDLAPAAGGENALAVARGMK